MSAIYVTSYAPDQRYRNVFFIFQKITPLVIKDALKGYYIAMTIFHACKLPLIILKIVSLSEQDLKEVIRMHFDLKKPCKHCPFRNTELTFDWLGEQRAAEIAAVIESGKTFACHKTVIHDGDSYIQSKHESHCAGALIMIEKTQYPHQMTQIAERLGLYKPIGFRDTDQVFNNFREFIDHHAGIKVKTVYS